MIVDDTRLIIGSANINDRSLLGSRDSEIAVCIEGPASFNVQSSSGPVGVVKKIHDFRKSLFKEHFGVDINVPSDEASWKQMWDIIRTNTEVFSKVFKIYPSDQFADWQSLQSRDKKFDQGLFDAESPKIKGHAVLYPHRFLRNVNLLDKNTELSMMVVPIYALF